MMNRERFLEHLRTPSAELLCPKCSNPLVEDGDDGWYWCHRCEDDVFVGVCRECGGPADQRVVNGMMCGRCADQEVAGKVRSA